jgi:hypothetical protein
MHQFLQSVLLLRVQCPVPARGAQLQHLPLPMSCWAAFLTPPCHRGRLDNQERLRLQADVCQWPEVALAPAVQHEHRCQGYGCQGYDWVLCVVTLAHQQLWQLASL